jgi:hypothetical protein
MGISRSSLVQSGSSYCYCLWLDCSVIRARYFNGQGKPQSRAGYNTLIRKESSPTTSSEITSSRLEGSVSKQAALKDSPLTKDRLTAAADCCRIVPNAQLKSLGRIVVSFPKDSKAGGTRIDIFKANDKESIKVDYGSMKADLVPGQYDLTVGGRPMKGIEVRAAHDTNIRVGVLRVHVGSGTRVDIFEPGKTDALRRVYGSGDIGLPVGRYEVQVAGQRATVSVKEDEITEF